MSTSPASPASSAIELIVGLGNPGPAYAKTRHNAGAWFVESVCKEFQINLKSEPKFNARVGQSSIAGFPVRVLISNSYMNHSGQAVGAIANYFQIAPQSILVAHDELDIPTGSIRLKLDGGHGGHNGLRDIISHLKNTNFARLRIGIDHPGNKDKVMEYVLNVPSAKDEKLIHEGIEKAINVLPEIITGQWQKAMNWLHTEEKI